MAILGFRSFKTKNFVIQHIKMIIKMPRVGSNHQPFGQQPNAIDYFTYTRIFVKLNFKWNIFIILNLKKVGQIHKELFGQKN